MSSLSKLFRLSFAKEDYYAHGNILMKDYGVIYFPIPKVACSSIKKIFADLLGLKYDLHDIDDSVHELDFPFARRDELMTGHYDGYFKFALVRNPWDRLYSCFRSKILDDTSVHGDGWHHGVFGGFLRYGDRFHSGMSFQSFVEAVCAIPDLYADEHFRSQYVTLIDDKGDLMLDHIGRMEEIDATWEQVMAHMQIDIALPRLMTSKRQPWRKVYTPDLVERVAKRYEQDIRRFGYEVPELS